MRAPLIPLPLPANATFADLVFRQHPDGKPDHLQALHRGRAGKFSVTRGGLNFGEPGAPYEMQGPDGEIHAPLTQDGVTELLQAYGQLTETK